MPGRTIGCTRRARRLCRVREDEPYDALAALTAAQLASARRLIAYCDRLRPADPFATVIVDCGADSRFERTPRTVLTHLFVHQIHHRGQAHAMLSGTSFEPPQLDEFFLDQDAALRRDELRALALL